MKPFCFSPKKKNNPSEKLVIGYCNSVITVLVERTFAMSKLSAEYYLLLLEVCKSIYGEDFVNRCPHQLERWGFKLFRHSAYYRSNSLWYWTSFSYNI